jgi:hypothetical protein
LEYSGVSLKSHLSAIRARHLLNAPQFTGSIERIGLIADSEVMNAKLLFGILVTGCAVSAYAGEPPSGQNLNASGLAPLQWDASESHWDRILSERRSITEFRLGGGNFVASGPLIDGFRRERLPEDASLGRRFLGLPVVRLFVPQRLPSPPGGTGTYFAWRNSDRSWSEVVAGVPPGSAFSPLYNEPQGILISIGHRNR